jgi:hypothetical protein
MNEQEMFKRFKEVVLNEELKGKRYTFTMSPNTVVALHGAIAFVMKHPEIKKMSGVMPVLKNVRQELLRCMRSMGFTEEEVRYMDTKEKDV